MERIDSIDDERLAPYRDLKDRTLRGEQLFVAEGLLLVERLLESSCRTESVLAAERFAERLAPLVPPGVPLYVAPEKLLSQVVGFKFHRGVLASGCRPRPATLEGLLAARGRDDALTLIVCPQITDRENLGAICRVASAFGAHGVVLGKECCDPFSRRVLRVSMGAVFRLPIIQAQDLQPLLGDLRKRWNVELWASVLDTAAEQLDRIRPPKRLAILFGHETHGLGERWASLCDRRVTIPMRLGTDSLNVAVAAGVFVYVATRGREG